ARRQSSAHAGQTAVCSTIARISPGGSWPWTASQIFSGGGQAAGAGAGCDREAKARRNLASSPSSLLIEFIGRLLSHQGTRAGPPYRGRQGSPPSSCSTTSA